MRNRFLINFLLILAIMAVVGGSAAVIAYMFRETQVETNELIPAELTCTVHESFDGTTKSSITVENTGNINAYIRVRLVTYWVNEEGNIAPKSSGGVPTFTPGSDWISGANNTYYYKYKVSPGLSTHNLIDKIELDSAEDGTVQVIDVFAEAIQAEPADAVNKSWPEVSANDNGELAK